MGFTRSPDPGRWRRIASLVLVLAAGPGAARAELRYHDPAAAFAGYTLLTPADPAYRGGAVLIDMEGAVVHEWTTVGFPTLLLPGGSIISRSGILADLPLSGSSEEILQESWDGAIEMRFRDYADYPGVGRVSRQAHDIQREGSPVGYHAPGLAPDPEGTTLVLAFADREDTGELAPPRPIVDGVLYELSFDGRIGWEWSALDHLHQFGFDDAVYADISRYGGDVFVLNAASRLGPNRHFRAGDARFHPDNILISSRNLAWMGIVERATGDIVWTLGPEYESEAERALEPLIGTHQAHLIPDGLPGAGNLLVLDNGFYSGYGGSPVARAVVEALLGREAATFGYRYARGVTRVVEVDPVTLELVWSHDPRTGADLTWSPITGGAQRLPNGNTLITSGAFGRIVEVTPDGRVVWDYVSPYRGILSNALYRASRVPPEYLPEGENEAAAGYPRWGAGGGGGCAVGDAGRAAAGSLPAALATLLVVLRRVRAPGRSRRVPSG